MIIELIGGPADGMILDSMFSKVPDQFILPAVCLGIGYVYVGESDPENDLVRYRFTGYCSLRPQANNKVSAT